jgi:hypothetical protein
MMSSFQDFADATGVTANFRMSNRRFAWLVEVYDAWRCVAPPSEWECGEVVMCQRGRGVVHLHLSYGSVVTVKVHR